MAQTAKSLLASPGAGRALQQMAEAPKLTEPIAIARDPKRAATALTRFSAGSAFKPTAPTRR